MKSSWKVKTYLIERTVSEMERLTYWDCEWGCWSYHVASGDAAKRLAAYEDTGYTPEEIEALKTDNDRLHRLIDELENSLRKGN